MTLAETSPEMLQLLGLVVVLLTALAARFEWLKPVVAVLKKLLPAKDDATPKPSVANLLGADEQPSKAEVARMLNWIEQASGEDPTTMQLTRLGKFSRQYANRMTIIESLQAYRTETQSKTQEASE